MKSHLLNTESKKQRIVLTHQNYFLMTHFALDGYKFYDFIENGILNTIAINGLVNFDFVVSDKIDGKMTYITPGNHFKELLSERYMN